MEGYSKIDFNNKTIFYVNYSVFRSLPDPKEKILELLKFNQADLLQQPLNSVLTLVNVSHLHFDLTILKLFKESTDITLPYEKKLAVVGIKGLLKSGYNYVVGLSPNNKVQAFDTEEEAKEWLVKED